MLLDILNLLAVDDLFDLSWIVCSFEGTMEISNLRTKSWKYISVEKLKLLHFLLDMELKGHFRPFKREVLAMSPFDGLDSANTTSTNCKKSVQCLEKTLHKSRSHVERFPAYGQSALAVRKPWTSSVEIPVGGVVSCRKRYTPELTVNS